MDQVRTSTGGDAGSQRDAARIEAWNAAQWLARMTRSFACAPERHGDVGLRWHQGSKTIVTPEIAPETALELSLATLNFQFLEHGSPSPHVLDPDGKSSTEIEAWLLVEMLHRDFDREAFSKSLPYRMPSLMSGDEAKYNSLDLAQELDQLTQRLSDAADILFAVRTQLGSRDIDAQLICWPEKLDIGFTVPLWEPSAEAELVQVGYTLGNDDGVKSGFYVKRETDAPPPSMSADLSDESIADNALSPAKIVEVVLAAFKTLRAVSAH